MPQSLITDLVGLAYLQRRDGAIYMGFYAAASCASQGMTIIPDDAHHPSVSMPSEVLYGFVGNPSQPRLGKWGL